MKKVRTTMMVLALLLLSPAVYAANVSVGIQDFQFVPPSITINAGDSVTWTNNAGMAHTTTSGGNCIADGIWDSDLIQPGQSFTRIFASPGTFPFHCKVDSHCVDYGMQGTVTVNAAAPMMPLPGTQLIVPPYGPIVAPVLNSDPALAMPVAAGSIAQGGGSFTLQVQTYQFPGPVDLYLAITAPALDPVNIYLLTPAGLQTVAAAGIVPWMTNVSGVNATPLGSIPVSLLPPATYNLFLAITPAGTLGTFDLWETSFTR
jgi:plastocyanin